MTDVQGITRGLGSAAAGRLRVGCSRRRWALLVRGWWPSGLWALALGSCLWWAGCGARPPEAPAADREEASLYREGKGLKLEAEARRSLGLQTTAAGPQAVHRMLTAPAQVFARGTNESGEVHARVSAFLAAGVECPGPGSRARLRTTAPPAAVATGAVARVETVTGTAFGQIEVVAEVPDAAGRFPEGSAAEAQFDVGVKPAAVAIPRAAIIRAALGDFVYVAEGEFLRRVKVKPGVEDGAWVEIIEGLAAGQAVVTHGAQSLWLLELSEVGGMMNIQ